MRDEPSVLVDRPGVIRGRESTSSPVGRICECCPTILSRYNPSPWCSLHEGDVRRMRNLFGGFSHGTVLRDIEIMASDRPLFRCDGCEHAWPISYQWISARLRFCAWCRPESAIRSDALELAS